MAVAARPLGRPLQASCSGQLALQRGRSTLLQGWIEAACSSLPPPLKCHPLPSHGDVLQAGHGRQAIVRCHWYSTTAQIRSDTRPRGGVFKQRGKGVAQRRPTKSSRTEQSRGGEGGRRDTGSDWANEIKWSGKGRRRKKEAQRLGLLAWDLGDTCMHLGADGFRGKVARTLQEWMALQEWIVRKQLCCSTIRVPKWALKVKQKGRKGGRHTGGGQRAH